MLFDKNSCSSFFNFTDYSIGGEDSVRKHHPYTISYSHRRMNTHVLESIISDSLKMY